MMWTLNGHDEVIRVGRLGCNCDSNEVFNMQLVNTFNGVIGMEQSVYYLQLSL